MDEAGVRYQRLVAKAIDRISIECKHGSFGDVHYRCTACKSAAWRRDVCRGNGRCIQYRGAGDGRSIDLPYGRQSVASDFAHFDDFEISLARARVTAGA